MYIGIWLWLIEGSVFPQMIKPFLSVLLISFLFCCLFGQKGGSEVSFGSGKLPGDNIKWQYIYFFFFIDFFYPFIIYLLLLLFYFTVLYWFCHTSTWIRHRCSRIPHPKPPSPTSLPIPSLWVIPVHQPQASCILHRTWTGDSFLIWYYTCFNAILSNHPPPLPQSPKDCSIHLCLFCCLAYRVIVTIFLNSIYMR